MIGKKNIVLGWVFLVFTTALGPYMVGLYTSVGSARQLKRAVLGRLQLALDSGFEDNRTLEPMSVEAIARLNTEAILALYGSHNARVPLDEIRGRLSELGDWAIDESAGLVAGGGHGGDGFS